MPSLHNFWLIVWQAARPICAFDCFRGIVPRLVVVRLVFLWWGHVKAAITFTATNPMFPPLGIPLCGLSRRASSRLLHPSCDPSSLHYHQTFYSLNPDMFCRVHKFLCRSFRLHPNVHSPQNPAWRRRVHRRCRARQMLLPVFGYKNCSPSSHTI